MKKKILLLITIIMCFISISNIKAAITSYITYSTDATSGKCNSNYCATTIFNSGIKVTLINSNGNKVSGTNIINFWPTQEMANYVNNGHNGKGIKASDVDNYSCKSHLPISSTNTNTNMYNSALGLPSGQKYNLYKNYISTLTTAKVTSIIKALTNNSTSDYSQYYLKIEPVYVIKERWWNGTSGYCKYFMGDSKQIIKNWGGLFETCFNDECSVYGRSRGRDYVYDGIYASIGGSWNVVRNYITAMYYDCTTKNAGGGPNVACYNANTYGALSNYSAANGSSSQYNLEKLNDLYVAGNGIGVGYVKISDYIPTKGNLRINIKSRVSNSLIISSNARFEIYKGTNCSGTLVSTKTTSMGSVTIDKLEKGTYSIKEVQHPSGYVASSNKCVKTNVSINADKTTTENIYYEPTCSEKLKDLGDNPTPQQLFNLYKDYIGNTNLLDLDNPSCSVATCNTKTLTLECLSGTNNPSVFTASNLSCYDGDPITNAQGNIVGFCSTTYKLTNNLGRSIFYGISGRTLLSQKGNVITLFEKNELNELVEKQIDSEYIATSDVVKTCYTLGPQSLDKSLQEFTVYFGDNDGKDGADELTEIPVEPVEDETTAANGLTKYTFKSTKNYKFNSFYLEKITGKWSGNQTIYTTNEPIYGILSNFYSRTGSIPYKVNNTSSNACKYELLPEIIKDDELDLEFRTIDTTTPFDRTTNSNWCDGNDCSSSNAIVTNTIINSNNSYNSTNEDSIYSNTSDGSKKIILTPELVKRIRDYNKNHKYNDYEITNEDGVEYNSFLHDFEIFKVQGD